MSRPIVAHASDNPNQDPRGSDPLVRGTFSDGHTDYTVRASSTVSPDSFQVSASGNPADLVLIVSGINSGNLHATWGQGWRTFAPDWKIWVEDAAFRAFYNGHSIGERSGQRRSDPRSDRRPIPGPLGPGGVRFCNG